MSANFTLAGRNENEKDIAAKLDGQHSPCERALDRLSILIAAVELDIRTSLSQLLQQYSVKTVCIKAVGEMRAVLARETFAACFSGFWLVDGTYRDVFRHLKRSPLAAPLVLVCGPSCPAKYKDYLASWNIRAFDFICHPYRKSELDRVLQRALGSQPEMPRQQDQLQKPYPWTLQVGQRYPAKA